MELISLGHSLCVFFFRVIAKSEGESIAAKFSCAFCETTAADDYEYVQQLFHRTVREVRKERERTMASNTIDEETSTLPINIPSPPSSLSSSSSIPFSTSIETDKMSPPNIPLPPPIPATLAHKAARAAKTIKQPESQAPLSTSPLSSSVKSALLSTATTAANVPAHPASATAKRTPSKSSSVFSKIFK